MKTKLLSIIAPPYRQPRTKIEKLAKFIKRGHLYYGGHYAVTKSILDGLNKMNIHFNYNPPDSKLSKNVVILDNINKLRTLIQLKRNGKISTLICGSLIAMTPAEIRQIDNFESIDIYFHPCQQVVDWWKQMDPFFPISQRVWCAGVDENYWKPKNVELNKNCCLLYIKNHDHNQLTHIKGILERRNFSILEIYYGQYQTRHYRELLNQVGMMVFLSKSESQGLALYEAWSMNVPTLVWNPGSFIWENKSYPMSSAPYLTRHTGRFFNRNDDFDKELLAFMSEAKSYQPRQWLLKNGTNKICAQKFINLIESIK